MNRALFAALIAGALALSSRSAQAAEHCGRVRFVTMYDSHGLTPFGERLDHALLARPDTELTSYTLGGASPSWFVRRTVSPRGYVFESCDGIPITPRSRLVKLDVRTPSLEQLLGVPLGTYDRQVVVLTLGSNVPGEPAVQTAAVEQIVRTIDARPDTVCVWVGPPSIRKWSATYSDQVYAAIRDGIRAAGGKGRREPACHLIDSRLFTSYPPGGDGMHLGFSPSHIAAANHWADGVEQAIDHILHGAKSPVEIAGVDAPR